MYSLNLPPRRSARLLSLGAIVLLALLPLACGGTTEEETPAGDPVEITGLGLRFARVPAGFTVAGSDQRLVLESDGTVDATAGGTMTVEAGEPSDFGLDPVDDANGQQAHFESLEGGEFLGVQKLIVPAGPAAYARGRFSENGEARERAVVFVVHPAENRMIAASYVYPAGDSAEDSRARVQQLFELVGEMETTAMDEPTGG